MVARGGAAGASFEVKGCHVEARVSVLDTLWCFLLPPGMADRDPSHGVWMREADYAAEG